MFAYIPVWVPVLFLGLLVLGYRLSLPRVVKPAALVAIAVGTAAFSLYGVASAFGAQAMVLVLWVAGYLMSASLGAKTFASRGLQALGGAVRMPASWAPLVLILGIFAAKFGLGFATGVNSPLLHQAGFVAVMSLLLGALSGGFGARALAVHRFASASARA